MTKSTPRCRSGPHLARCRKWTWLEPGLEEQSLPIHEGPDRCQEQTPGGLEVRSRAARFSRTWAAVSSSDPLVGQQWEVSIFPQTVGDKFPIRLISKEHSWHEGVCKGLCFSLRQTSPELSLGKLSSTGWGPPGICVQRAGLSPAPRPLPGSQAAWSDQSEFQEQRDPSYQAPLPRACWRVLASCGKDRINP